MKSQWFGCPRRAEFGKCLRSADSGLRHEELMACFLECATSALLQANNRFVGKFDQALEDKFESFASRLKYRDRLPEALAILVAALEDRPYDFLGTFLSELGMNDVSFRGQCFTPASVCELMADLILRGLQPTEKRILLAEPAVGGGAMVIASTVYLRKNGFGPLHYYWDVTDVDWRMASITFIQLTLLDIPATITHGNTLTLEKRGQYRTFCAMRYPYRPADSTVKPARMEVPEPVLESQPKEQLLLF